MTGVPADVTFDHAFECVGGEGSPKAINRIIDLIKPEGTISILKPAGVGQDRPFPVHEAMDAAERSDEFVAGAEIEMICVVQDE